MDPFPMLKICFVEPKSTDTGKKSRLFLFGGKALTKKSKRIGLELLGNHFIIQNLVLLYYQTGIILKQFFPLGFKKEIIYE